jgi:nitrite reductase/ring-hydroxylating ferredoxin subunit
LPLTVEIGAEPFCIVDIDGERVAYSPLCPHQLGPLGRAEVRDGVIECPWHGYRFDIRSRQRVHGGQHCRLAKAPALSIDATTREVIIRW